MAKDVALAVREAGVGILSLPPSNCVSWDEWLKLSGPMFPHLQDGDKNSNNRVLGRTKQKYVGARGMVPGRELQEHQLHFIERGSLREKASSKSLEALRGTEPFLSLSSCLCGVVILAQAASLIWGQRRGKDQLLDQPRIEKSTPKSHSVFQEK